LQIQQASDRTSTRVRDVTSGNRGDKDASNAGGRIGPKAAKLKEIVGKNTNSVEEIVQLVLSHCVGLTSRSRKFMEDHPDERLETDYVKYPGKMDHATCL